MAKAKGTQSQRKKRKPAKKAAYQIVKYEGVGHRLAKVTTGRQLTKAQKLKIAALVCYIYADDKNTIDQCLEFCGLSDRTWYNWLKQYSEISEMYRLAIEEKTKRYKVKLKERARTMAEKCISGYTVRTKTEKSEMQNVLDKDGKIVAVKMLVTETIEKEIYIRPSVALIHTVLFNMDGRNFERSPDKQLKPDDETTNIKPIEWVE